MVAGAEAAKTAEGMEANDWVGVEEPVVEREGGKEGEGKEVEAEKEGTKN